jgi:hypothetical protein
MPKERRQVSGLNYVGVKYIMLEFWFNSYSQKTLVNIIRIGVDNFIYPDNLQVVTSDSVLMPMFEVSTVKHIGK